MSFKQPSLYRILSRNGTFYAMAVAVIMEGLVVLMLRSSYRSIGWANALLITSLFQFILLAVVFHSMRKIQKVQKIFANPTFVPGMISYIGRHPGSGPVAVGLIARYRFSYEGKQFFADSSYPYWSIKLSINMPVTIALDSSNPNDSEIVEKYI